MSLYRIDIPFIDWFALALSDTSLDDQCALFFREKELRAAVRSVYNNLGIHESITPVNVEFSDKRLIVQKTLVKLNFNCQLSSVIEDNVLRVILKLVRPNNTDVIIDITSQVIRTTIEYCPLSSHIILEEKNTPLSELEARRINYVNEALRLLGEPAITKFDVNGSPAERLAALLYDEVRTTVLRAADWPFAMARRTCPFSLSFSDKHFYVLPPNCLRVVTCSDPTLKRVDPFNIITSIKNDFVEISYIFNLIDETEFSAEFEELLIVMLARRMCVPLTANAPLRTELNDRAKTLLKNIQAQFLVKQNQDNERPTE